MPPKLLPIDLLNKSFPRRWRGYDRSAVSNFLEEVASSMEEVIAHNSSLTQRLQAAEEALATYKTMESTLNEALILAQKTSREILLNAQKEADLILAQAKQEKGDIFRSAKDQLASLQKEIDELNQVKQRFLADLRGLLASVWGLAQDSRVPHPPLPLPLEEPARPTQEEAIPALSNLSC